MKLRETIKLSKIRNLNSRKYLRLKNILTVDHDRFKNFFDSFAIRAQFIFFKNDPNALLVDFSGGNASILDRGQDMIRF
jgi:hypothetical protein